MLSKHPMVTVTSTCYTYSGVRAVCDVMRVCTVQVEDIVPGVAVNVQNTEQEQLVKIAAPPRGHSLNRAST